MRESEIYGRLTKTFRDVLDPERTELCSESSAADVDRWDSLNHVKLIAAAEAAFGIKFKSADPESMGGVGDKVRLIFQKRSA
jgi:acyl carrier protein